VTVYSVYEPIGEDDDIVVRADKIAFVKEGFCWPALIVPALWLIYHRMWIALIVFLVVIGGVQWLFGTDPRAVQAAGWVTLGLTALFAFEANDLRGWALQRRGYRFAAVASGRDRHDAERAFFTAWLPQQERASRPARPAPKAMRGDDAPAPSRGGEGEEVIGLFPQG
jgi:hypothetical protein